MSRPIVANIDIKALKNNLSVVRRLAPKQKIWAVLKGEAYGHGFVNVFSCLSAADGFAVLDIDDALFLRDLGWFGPILLLEGFFSKSDLRLAALNCLTTVVHSIDQLQLIKEASVSCLENWLIEGNSNLQKKWKSLGRHVLLGNQRENLEHSFNLDPHLCVYLKMNTGMNRLGFDSDLIEEVWHQLKAIELVGEITFMTHFHSADELSKTGTGDNLNEGAIATHLQFDRFTHAIQGLPGKISVANSAAILWASKMHGDWVRPGIILYGSSPSGNSQDIKTFNLQSAMTLCAEIISIQTLEPGDVVGYGASFRAEKKMRIGVVACGYADGYPRHANSQTPVWVNGVRTFLVGRVSMDMLAIDLTSCANAGIGTMVELWGRNLSVDDVAKTCSTIGYELLTAIMPRVPLRLINT